MEKNGCSEALPVHFTFSSHQVTSNTIITPPLSTVKHTHHTHHIHILSHPHCITMSSDHIHITSYYRTLLSSQQKSKGHRVMQLAETGNGFEAHGVAILKTQPSS
jgi:hypothetical protein